MTLTTFHVKKSDPLFYRFMNGKQWRLPDNPHEKLNRKNEAIMAYLFNATMNGIIKGFHLVDNETFKAYHRSTKEDNCIQLSMGYYKNGELIPTCDVQLHNIKEMEREGYPHGIWEVIA